MAKPKVFISSTYYDLKYVREHLAALVEEQLGYDVVSFEQGDIAFAHNAPLDESCYRAAEASDIFVLIIGGRYGSRSSATNPKRNAEFGTGGSASGSETYQSVTETEYQRARARGVPVYVMVEKSVMAEYRTFLKNEGRALEIEWAHVDNPAVFKFLQRVESETHNNLIWAFDTLEQISVWLRDQWAGLFGDLLREKVGAQSLRPGVTSAQGATEQSRPAIGKTRLVVPFVASTAGYIGRFVLTQTTSEQVGFAVSVRNSSGLVLGGSLSGVLAADRVTMIPLATLLPADTTDCPGPYHVTFDVDVNADAVHGTYVVTAPNGVVGSQLMIKT